MRSIAPSCLPCLITLLLAFVPRAIAQPDPSPSAQSPDDQTQRVEITDLFRQIAKAEPGRRAGLRADLIRRTQQTVPTVVLVSDARSYLHAIAGWEGVRRYPILWDDGSPRAAEDIARFVRAFKPTSVVRHEAPGNALDWASGRESRERIVSLTAARAISDDADDYDAALASLRDQGLVSPGIVLTDVDDPGWTAALALAAARLQPVGFITAPGSIWQPLTDEQGDELERAAQRLAESTGLTWRSIGDQIDAVTLCANISVKLKFGPGNTDVYATSARLGRLGTNGTGERWANTGQVFGSFQQATYRAMSALFLTPADAFVFDGYEDTAPWNTYDGTRARDTLASAGFNVQLYDTPGNTAAAWTALTARPVRAGLILINTHGSQSVINLQQGKVRFAEFPLLEIPAIAHIVHSFSTANPANPSTVAGSMLDHGVYAMLGSVDEPYLQAFVPTPAVAQRLLAGYNFASAVRFDDAPVWKLAVLGDPLITLGPAGQRPEDPDNQPADLGLAGVQSDLDNELKSALGERDFSAAARALTMLGRDRDAARLASAILDDPDATITPEHAAASIPALFRDRRFEQVLTAYANLTEEQRQDPMLGDCFWFSARFLANSSGDRERAQRLMRTYQRPDSRLADAEEIAMRIRNSSVEEAVLFLETFRPSLTKQWEFNTLDDALNRVRTGR
jgi:hypothetical protein